MAREDTRWFAVAVVCLSIVLFMALPVALLVIADHLKMKAEMKAEVRAEIRKMQKLGKELNEKLAEKAKKEDE